LIPIKSFLERDHRSAAAVPLRSPVKICVQRPRLAYAVIDILAQGGDMRTTVTGILLVGMILLGAATAFAGAPLSGDYKSSDLGGPISTGRYTEGWAAGGSALSVGTTHNAQSWNGTALGTEWRYTCGRQLTPAILLFDAVNGSGNGNRTYMCTFTGGTIWMSGAGPWGNGDPSYSGPIDTYKEFETIQYSGGAVVGSVTNVQAVAHFDGYPASCVAFAISNGTLVGGTAFGGTLPANYPGLLDGSTCAATMTHGAWWNMCGITLSLSNCATPAKVGSWGSLRKLYR
jgi:hypothetical protein